jgi:hypothetical protein
MVIVILLKVSTVVRLGLQVTLKYTQYIQKHEHKTRSIQSFGNKQLTIYNEDFVGADVLASYF